MNQTLTFARWTGCLLLAVSAFFASSANAAEQPNILFIFADDWGWGDLGCHGHPYVKTPNIDRLAKEGTDFHRFTVASGVCSPSRTAVLTGHFPARYNIDGHFAWVANNAKRNMPDWLDPKTPTLPRFLKDAGYATAHFGKWHLSNDMIPDSPTPAEYGYDKYGAFNCSGEQMPVHEDADQAIAFIEKSQRAGKPFFINLWMHEPHTPFHAVPKYRWRFRDLEEPDNIYAAVLSHADDRIGKVLDALDRMKLTDNTLVIFSSDNGPARATGPVELELTYDTATGAGYGIAASKGITGGRKGYKAALFEGGIGVPFIARWPGRIAADKIDDRSLMSAVDLLPTFCELAGAKLPDSYKPDGVSQVATLKGQVSPLRTKPLFWKIDSAWPVRKNQPYHWVSYATVQDNWKLMANRDSSHLELIDIAADPYEQHDLQTDHPDVVTKLLQQLDDWKQTIPVQPTGNVFSELRIAPFVGNWALRMHNGDAGWLSIERVAGQWRGELWTVGQSKSITDMRVANGKLSFVRNCKIGQPEFPGGPPTGARVPCLHEATVDGDSIRIEMSIERADGTNASITHQGKRMPPLPAKPNLDKVKFGEPITLFNGTDLTGWRIANPQQKNGWKAVEGVLVNDSPKKTFEPYSQFGNLRTEREFGDAKLNIEFKVPPGGNSGIYVRGAYEVQVVDRDSRMQGIQGVGAIFGRIAPIENAGKPGDQWQSYEITIVDRHATIILNGETVIDNEPIAGCTNGAFQADETIPGPLYLQGDHTAVSYRNIVIQPVVGNK